MTQRETIEIQPGGFRDRHAANGTTIRLYRHPNNVGSIEVIRATGFTEDRSNALPWDDARALGNALWTLHNQESGE